MTTFNAAQFPAPMTNINFPMTAGTVVEGGDLIIVQSNKALPAASGTDQGTEALNQAYAAPKFLGVAKERKVSGNVDTTLDVILEWIGTMTCASATFVAGDMVTFCNNGGNTALESAKLKKTTNPTLAIGQVLTDYSSATTSVFVRLSSNFLRTGLANDLPSGVAGVAAGYKIARGVHTQVAASDTVVTGLATVVAVVAVPQTITVKQLFFQASIGDQAGTPAAGSILITSKKPTAVNDVTPIAATDFTDNIAVNWIAIGT